MLRDDILKTILNAVVDENEQPEKADVVLPPVMDLQPEIQQQLEQKIYAANESATKIDAELYTYSRVISNIVAATKVSSTGSEKEQDNDNYNPVITDTVEMYKKFITGLLFEDPSTVKEHANIANMIDNLLVLVQEKIEQGLLPKKVYITEDDLKIRMSEIVNQAMNELSEEDYSNIENLVSLESVGIDKDIYRDIVSSVYVYSYAIDKLFTPNIFKDEIELMTYTADRDMLLAEVSETLIDRMVQ